MKNASGSDTASSSSAHESTSLRAGSASIQVKACCCNKAQLEALVWKEEDSWQLHHLLQLATASRKNLDPSLLAEAHLVNQLTPSCGCTRGRHCAIKHPPCCRATTSQKLLEECLRIRPRGLRRFLATSPPAPASNFFKRDSGSFIACCNSSCDSTDSSTGCTSDHCRLCFGGLGTT